MLELVVVTLGCFAAAFVNAAFATGGVYIMLASISAILPLTVAIPLLPAFALPSLISRVYLFWQHINWPIVKSFVIGSVIGVLLGGQVFVSLSERHLSLMIGLLLLLLTWWPHIKVTMPVSQLFLYVGISHSFLGTLFGAGGILQSTIIRTSLLKAQMTGTLAASLFAMDIFKISSYMFNGFSYQRYLPHLCAATVAGYIGVWAGKRASSFISDKTFRVVFKIIITLVAVKFIYAGLSE